MAISDITHRQFIECVNGYCEAAEWAPSDPEDNDIELSNYDRDRTAPRQVYEFFGRCALAGIDCSAAIDAIGYSAARFGHDFWLSRNGHGAGFFDRKELPKTLRDELQNIARECGAVETYRDDDGKLRFDR